MSEASATTGTAADPGLQQQASTIASADEDAVNASTSIDYLDLCRLCLQKDSVNLSIFEEEGEQRQMFLKISATLPVKIFKEDKLPKKICDDCSYKVELLYQFWNTAATSEKQLLQWLGEIGLDDKQNYEVLEEDLMKSEKGNDNRLNTNIIQVSDQNSIEISMIDNISLITIPAGSEQFTTVPIDASGTIQTEAMQSSHDQSQIEEDRSEMGDMSDDGCDNEGLPVKEESDDQNNQANMDQAYVSIEAGPSGIQHQKISELTIQQAADGDPKTGFVLTKFQAAIIQDIPSSSSSPPPYHQYLLLPTTSGEKALDDYHQHQHQQQHFQCTLCGEAFVDEVLLEYHLKAHDEHETLTSVTLLNCDKCDRSFHDQDSYDKHHLQAHELLIEDAVVLPTTLEYKYSCEQCSARFTQRHQFDEHVCNTSSFRCEICHATFRYRQGLRLHAKLHEPDYVAPLKKHCCSICGKRFCRRQVMLIHMKTHVVDNHDSGGGNGGDATTSSTQQQQQPQQLNEFICHVCGKSVSSKTYLNVHVRKHTGEKPHVCEHCGKGFISQNYLSVHRRIHTGERPHKCPHCDKRFTQRTTLVVHTRSHTGDKPYSCSQCDKSFASKTMLNSHFKMHAKQMREVPAVAR